MRFAFCIQQNVPRFDVTMKNSVFMRVVNSACDLRDNSQRAESHRLAPGHFVELSASTNFMLK